VHLTVSRGAFAVREPAGDLPVAVTSFLLSLRPAPSSGRRAGRGGS
jgi:hypothetical protein